MVAPPLPTPSPHREGVSPELDELRETLYALPELLTRVVSEEQAVEVVGGWSLWFATSLVC